MQCVCKCLRGFAGWAHCHQIQQRTIQRKWAISEHQSSDSIVCKTNIVWINELKFYCLQITSSQCSFWVKRDCGVVTFSFPVMLMIRQALVNDSCAWTSTFRIMTIEAHESLTWWLWTHIIIWKEYKYILRFPNSYRSLLTYQPKHSRSNVNNNIIFNQITW